MTKNEGESLRGKRVVKTVLVCVSLVGLLVCVCAGVLWYWNYCFRHFGIYRALHEIVRAGDSMDEVQRVLGPGKLLIQGRDSLAVVIQITLADLNHHPDGVASEDTFLLYELPKNQRL
jgi:hypothetical protein